MIAKRFYYQSHRVSHGCWGDCTSDCACQVGGFSTIWMFYIVCKRSCWWVKVLIFFLKARLSCQMNAYYWSLLYSVLLRFRADSLHSHVILHEWIAFYSAFLNIHWSGVLTALAWLVPHETAAISAFSVYTIQPCTMSLHAKPHT